MVRLIRILGLSLLIFCLSVSNSFAQTEKEYRPVLEKYYQNKSAQEIWRDYTDPRMNLNPNLGSLVTVVPSLSEPFRSWAISEIVESNLFGIHLAVALNSNNFTKETKDRLYKNWLDSRPAPVFVNQGLSGLIDLLIHLVGESPYREDLVSKIMQDPFVVNSQLIAIISRASPQQQIEIANRVIYNQPSRSELSIISIHNIDFYSETAKSMLGESEVYGSDAYMFKLFKRRFLLELMKGNS